jgi:hypothetical protein
MAWKKEDRAFEQWIGFATYVAGICVRNLLLKESKV